MIDAMGDEIADVVNRINQDSSIRVVVLTGRGDVFSSGGDLDMIVELSKVSPEESHDFMMDYYHKYFSINQLSVPTIAMINGHAIGAGLCISLACDLRIIAGHAKVGVTFVNIGLNAGMGSTLTLAKIVGATRALELLLTGRMISADEALAIGLVNAVYPATTLREKTYELATMIASRAPLALKYTKDSFKKALAGTLEQTFEVEAAGQSVCYASQDILEGVTAIRERRPPRFSGQ